MAAGVALVMMLRLVQATSSACLVGWEVGLENLADC